MGTEDRAVIRPGEHPTNLPNLLRFVVTRPRLVPVLVNKIRKRLDGCGAYSPEENTAWIEQQSEVASEIATRLAPSLWEEAVRFGSEARAHAEPILAQVPFDMGGGGDHEFLYWLTRYRRPEVIVETGVCAGWSSFAFLAAIERNGSGTLFSSDFPLFRVRNPEDYIGTIVPTRLRTNWRLSTDGDENALPRILSSVAQVDLFHYDSDKSYSGRDFAVSTVSRKLAPDGVILVDDILNDSWFRERAERERGVHSVLDQRYGMIGSIQPGSNKGGR